MLRTFQSITSRGTSCPFCPLWWCYFWSAGQGFVQFLYHIFTMFSCIFNKQFVERQFDYANIMLLIWSFPLDLASVDISCLNSPFPRLWNGNFTNRMPSLCLPFGTQSSTEGWNKSPSYSHLLIYLLSVLPPGF